MLAQYSYSNVMPTYDNSATAYTNMKCSNVTCMRLWRRLCSVLECWLHISWHVCIYEFI